MELRSEKRIQGSIELRIRKLGELGPMLQGTPVRKYRKCATPDCPCKQGKKLHPFLVVSTKVARKTQTLYVPVAMEETVLSWVKNYRRAKTLLGEISGLCEQLVRMHCGRALAASQRKQLLESNAPQTFSEPSGI